LRMNRQKSINANSVAADSAQTAVDM